MFKWPYDRKRTISIVWMLLALAVFFALNMYLDLFGKPFPGSLTVIVFTFPIGLMAAGFFFLSYDLKRSILFGAIVPFFYLFIFIAGKFVRGEL